MRYVALPLLCLFLFAAVPIYGGLTPNDVVVVTNNNPKVATASRAVAEYYCAARGIPTSNILELTTAPEESLSCAYFLSQIQLPLKAFLQSRFGALPNEPGNDPIKAIVMCYGVPSRIVSGERNSSLDAAVSMLFDTSPWGQERIASWRADAYGMFANPYFREFDVIGTDEPSLDFAAFRAGPSNRGVPSRGAAPDITTVRMLDSNHALAGAQFGALLRGVREDGVWAWTPVPDASKGFIGHDFAGISALDSSHAWAWTEGGSVIRTDDGGVTWTTVRSGTQSWDGDAGPVMKDCVIGASFYSQQNGWVLGELYTGGYWLEKRSSSGSAPGELPSGLSPRCLSCTASGVWLSGSNGIWYSTDGLSWTQQCTSEMFDIWVGGSGDGWAIRQDGQMMHTSDGQNWTESGVALPTSGASTADLAAYDGSHIAIAWRDSGQIFLYDGGPWHPDCSEALVSESSAAWAGGDVLATYGSALRQGQGFPGAVSWSDSYVVPKEEWSIRYLVSRLDGYSDPVTEIEPGVSIPTDVKNLIDRSMGASPGGKFVFDFKSAGNSDAVDCLRGIVGSANVVADYTSTFLMNQTNVTGYCGMGSYADYTPVHSVTAFWRPRNVWRDGSVGLFKAVSNDAKRLRSPAFINRFESGDGAQAGMLKVTGLPDTIHYAGDWAGLYTYDGEGRSIPLCYSDNSQVRAEFTQIANGRRSAVIDLAGVVWPTDYAHLEVHFADNDPFHPGEVMGEGGKTAQSTEIHTARDLGIAYELVLGQSLISELIRDGCSATAGNVSEPWDGAAPQATTILPQYARGCTWAESAYMGFRAIGWRELAIGDPLMAPYADTPPSVSISLPDEVVLSGMVGVTADAQSLPDTITGINRVEFWITNGSNIYKRVSTAYDQPYFCMLDTVPLPDGSYTIRAVAYEANPQGEAAETFKAVTIHNSGIQASADITEPDADGPISDTVAVEADVSCPETMNVTALDFWLAGLDGTHEIASVSSWPYTASLDSTIFHDGEYTLYATAQWTEGTDTGMFGGTPRLVTVANTGKLSITSPANGDIVSGEFTVDIHSDIVGPPSVTEVLLTAKCGNTTISAGPGPSSIVIDSRNLPDGECTITAEAVKDGGGHVAETASCTVIIANQHQFCARIQDARKLPDPTEVALQLKHVVAGTGTTSMDGAFYIEEEDRSAGVRVAWTGSAVEANKLVTILGFLRNNASGEREIAATAVYVAPGTVTVRPLVIMDRDVGGGTPAGDAQTVGTSLDHGTYNVGMLITTAGTVTYLDSGIAYIDGGGFLYDGNGLPPARTLVPLDGSDIVPGPGAPGLRVYLADLPGVAVNDFVVVSGISSLCMIGESRVPMIRACTLTNDESFPYTPAVIEECVAKSLDFFDPLDVGAVIRLSDDIVQSNNGTSLVVLDYWIAQPDLDSRYQMEAQTALQTGDTITVYGTYNGSQGGFALITPDRIYRHSSGGAGPSGPMSMSSLSYSPVTRYSETAQGPTDTAVAQPDDTRIDLTGVMVISQSEDGMTWGLKDVSEPMPTTPRLVLRFDQPMPKIPSASFQVDIHGATLTTLPDGQRVVTEPEEVLLYTDAKGSPSPPMSVVTGALDLFSDWPWKARIFP